LRSSLTCIPPAPQDSKPASRPTSRAWQHTPKTRSILHWESIRGLQIRWSREFKVPANGLPLIMCSNIQVRACDWRGMATIPKWGVVSARSQGCHLKGKKTIFEFLRSGRMVMMLPFDDEVDLKLEASPSII
jgi:hypothetical protein